MAHETNSILCKLFLLPLNKSLKKGDERSQKHLETNEFVWNFFLKEHFSYGVIERVHSWHHTYVENIYTRIYWEMEMQFSLWSWCHLWCMDLVISCPCLEPPMVSSSLMAQSPNSLLFDLQSTFVALVTIWNGICPMCLVILHPVYPMQYKPHEAEPQSYHFSTFRAQNKIGGLEDSYTWEQEKYPVAPVPCEFPLCPAVIWGPLKFREISPLSGGQERNSICASLQSLLAKTLTHVTLAQPTGIA